jgi:hypothetical protein
VILFKLAAFHKTAGSRENFPALILTAGSSKNPVYRNVPGASIREEKKRGAYEKN